MISYFSNHALDLSPGIVDLGGLKWDLVGCLALAWLACFLCLFKGNPKQQFMLHLKPNSCEFELVSKFKTYVRER